MLIPIIKVKDGEFEHIVGTNSHDVLYVDQESGGIQYLNIQCQEGTKIFDGEQTMQFAGIPGYFEDLQIQFITVEELLELVVSHMKEGTESRLQLHEKMEAYLAAKKECQDKLEHDDVWNSSGMLLF